MCDYFTLNFTKRKIQKYTIETVCPFDEHHEFNIVVNSPSEVYYTDIFWTCLLDINKAWDLYKKLFDRQVQDVKTERDILEKFQAHFGTLELQFKYFYSTYMEKNIKKLKPPEGKNDETVKKEIEEFKNKTINKKLK